MPRLRGREAGAHGAAVSLSACQRTRKRVSRAAAASPRTRRVAKHPTSRLCVSARVVRPAGRPDLTLGGPPAAVMAEALKSSWAAAASGPKAELPLRSVQLDGLAVLKIVKHCTECQPSLVTGQLLGLDIGTSLEVTNCFPFPVRARRGGARRRGRGCVSAWGLSADALPPLRRRAARLRRARMTRARAPTTSWR